MKFPEQFSGFLVERVHITARLATSVSHNRNDITKQQWVAVKTERASISARVIGPDFFSRGLVQGKKFSCARTDEEQVSTDRGLGKDSAAGLRLPQDGSRRLCERRRGGQQQH